MWNLKPGNEEYISIHFMPDRLTMCSIKKAKRPSSLSDFFHVTAFSTISLLHNEYEQGKMYNPTFIAKQITDFLITTHKKGLPIAITLTGSDVRENIVFSPTALLSPSTLSEEKYDAFQTCYLYPQEDGQFVFYTCALDRSIIMQYQLMALTHAFNLCSLSTPSMAHLNVYRYFQGSSFSHSALADLLTNNNNTFSVLTRDYTIDAILQVDPSIAIPVDQKQFLYIALGAIIMH